MQKNILSRIFALSIFVLVVGAQQLGAQSFFYRETNEADKLPSTVEANFLYGENSSIQFVNRYSLSKFLAPSAEVKEGTIERRELSDTERALDAGLWILTGLMVLGTHDIYDLGGDLKMISMRGLLFFIFPFESHSLYRSCDGTDYLVATSEAPTPENLSKLKPLDELHRLCDPKTNAEPSSDIDS